MASARPLCSVGSTRTALAGRLRYPQPLSRESTSRRSRFGLRKPHSRLDRSLARSKTAAPLVSSWLSLLTSLARASSNRLKARLRGKIRTTRLASATASHDEDVEEQDISDSTSEDSSDMDQERPPHHHAWPAQLDHPLADVLIADGTDGVALGSPYLPYSPAEQVRRRMEARTREGADAGDGSEVEDESGEGEGEEGEGSSGGDDEGELENEDGEKEETEGEEAGGSSGNES